jgi:hypothetical protein
VLAAITEGHLSLARFNNYRKLREELHHLASRRREAERHPRGKHRPKNVNNPDIFSLAVAPHLSSEAKIFQSCWNLLGSFVSKGV